MSAEERRSWQRFMDAAIGIHESINATLVKTHQLTLFDVHVLHTLHVAPGGSARMGTLAELLLLLPSRLSQQVGRLEKQGLVRRDRSSRDKRVVIARITAQGRARLQPALRTYAREVRRSYLGPLSRQQMTALGSAARKVSDALKESGLHPGL
jgi:DNA-binding MarR family transcriptional regulator